MTFIEEIKARGMLQDLMPGTEEQLNKEMTIAYVGIDPTADSLHIGHLVTVMLLKHFQRSGHKPVVLVGGATGMIGDPSGKSEERNLLTLETLENNKKCIQNQLRKFLDFNDASPNKALMVDNYQWMHQFSFLDFIRDIGKHITVNYMMSKDSVKKRITGDAREGMSFTEFTYQLVQGYDFLHLYRTLNCKLQMGGSDQWGNITTGTELIRRIEGGEAYAITCPLITKADGGKFGKTEKGNVWLSPEYTSPYQFYQFWMNVTDEEAKKYLKIFTIIPVEEIDDLILQHNKEPHLRILQKSLAKEITTMVHSENDYLTAVEASQILFGKGTRESLNNLNENDFLSIFEGVPVYNIQHSLFNNEIELSDLLTNQTNIFESKSELRRLIESGGLSINKEKIITFESKINKNHLINSKYILIQKGKKNYFLIKSQ